jgi:hypothetical protein
MTRPENLFEAASYDLNKFRERRMAERRSVPRGTADRRMRSDATQPGTAQTPPTPRNNGNE